MKVLIVGGCGFVGSWLAHLLISKKHKVVIIDPQIHFSTWDVNSIKNIVKFKKEKLLNGAKIYRKKFEEGGDSILKIEKPDAVVHLGGIPLEKPKDYEFSLNQLSKDISMTYQVVRAVKDCNIKKFVFMSSISAYGDCGSIFKETRLLLPKTPYGITKAAGEYLVYSELDNWNIVRTTNVYGFGDLNGRASNIILNKILKGEKFWVNSDIKMDFTYVKDLASGIYMLLKKERNQEVFHLSGGHARKLLDYVKILKKHYSFDYEIRKIHDRPNRGTMDNSKARKLLGWKPVANLETGVEDYLKYVKKYKIA